MTQADLVRAVELLKQAVELDPQYAMAWVALSRAYWVQSGYGWRPVEAGFEQSRAAAQRALALAPELAEAHAALALVLSAHDWDWQGSLDAYERALELAPENVEALRGYSGAIGVRGRQEEALGLLRRAVALDPLNWTSHRLLGLRCAIYGHLEEGEAALRTALDLNPGQGLANCFLAIIRLFQGHAGDALQWAGREVLPDFRLYGTAIAEHTLGHAAESDRALDELIEKFGVPAAYQVAEATSWRGETDRAFEWLERAYTLRDPGLAHVKTDPFFKALHPDARWRPFLEKMRLAD